MIKEIHRCLLLSLLNFYPVTPYQSPEEAVRQYSVQKCNLLGRGRPVTKFNEAVTIEVSFIPLIFRGIDDKYQKYTLLAELDFLWTHPCLNWEDHPVHKNVTTFIDLLGVGYWYPVILHMNGAGEPRFANVAETSIIDFYSNGEIMWSLLYPITSTCTLDLKHFPFDVQICSIDLESWQNVNLVKLKAAATEIEIDEKSFVSPSEVWKVWKNARAEVKPIYYSSLNKTFHRLVLSIAMARRAELYIFSVLVPSFGLIFLQIFIGFIEPSSVDRPLCSITILLAFIFFQDGVTGTMPSSSEIPYIITLLNGKLFIGFFCSIYTFISCRVSTEARFNSLYNFEQPVKVRMRIIRIMDLAFYGCVALVTITFDILMVGFMSKWKFF